jgi:hypothetical protein
MSWAEGLVLNEVFYDPTGADAGQEYVELHNAGAHALVLDGVVLEAGNGARPGAWDVQWSAPEGLVLEPAGLLWVGGVPEGVSGQPDAAVDLHIQNGPDAVRIRRGDSVLDVVGWGDLDLVEYYEGSPAPDVPAGQALGRVPDGKDTGSNAVDLSPLLQPSPGQPNEMVPSLLLEMEGARPSVARPGERVSWSACIRNNSMESISLEGWRLLWGSRLLDVELPGIVTAVTCQTLEWEDIAPDGRGLHRLPLSLSSQRDTLTAEAVLRVGTGSLVVAEIQYDPRGDEGEWVELVAREEILSLEGWGMEDAGSSAILLTDPRPASKGDRFILAQKPEALATLLDQSEASLVLQYSGSWPSLNNTRVEEIQAADILLLNDPGGAPSDYAPYDPLPGSGDGVSLVRRDPEWPARASREWLPSPEGSTPGRAGKLDSVSPLEGRLLVDPPLLRRGNDVGSFILPPNVQEAATWEAGVFDVSGRRVRTLGLLRDMERQPAFLWDGRDEDGHLVAPGAYLVCVRSYGEEGSSSRWAASVTVSP